MGWADRHIVELTAGRSVSFRPRGNSMGRHIPSGALVTVVPVDENLQAGQIVLCKLNGSQFLHFAASIDQNCVRIENASGHVNGWTSLKNVYGVVVSVNGKARS